MSNHDVERALVQGLLDIADNRFGETIEAMRTDVDRLRDSWAAGYAEQRQAHEERLAAIRAETQRHLQAIANGEADQPAPPQDVAAGGLGDASAASPSTGHGRRQQPDPYAAEMAEAERIRAMPLNEYAKLRSELGIRSATDLNRLGGS